MHLLSMLQCRFELGILYVLRFLIISIWLISSDGHRILNMLSGSIGSAAQMIPMKYSSTTYLTVVFQRIIELSAIVLDNIMLVYISTFPALLCFSFRVGRNSRPPFDYLKRSRISSGYNQNMQVWDLPFFPQQNTNIIFMFFSVLFVSWWLVTLFNFTIFLYTSNFWLALKLYVLFSCLFGYVQHFHVLDDQLMTLTGESFCRYRSFLFLVFSLT